VCDARRRHFPLPFASKTETSARPVSKSSSKEDYRIPRPSKRPSYWLGYRTNNPVKANGPHVRDGSRLCENSDVELAHRTSVSITSNRKRTALEVTVKGGQERRQFYAFFARARFHNQKATSADDRTGSALLPRTDVAPAAGGAVPPRGMTIRAGMHGPGSPSGPNHLTLSSSSVQGLTFRPRAIRAILSIETLRSDRSTPLR
jgi:hypothetical protein